MPDDSHHRFPPGRSVGVGHPYRVEGSAGAEAGKGARGGGRVSQDRTTQADAEQVLAGREARREAEWARRDAEYAEQARRDERIDEAAVVAVEVLPAGVGEALAALLEAMKPWKAPDGHMSFSAIGRSSPEVWTLAEAILAAPRD